MRTEELAATADHKAENVERPNAGHKLDRLVEVRDGAEWHRQQFLALHQTETEGTKGGWVSECGGQNNTTTERYKQQQTINK